MPGNFSNRSTRRSKLDAEPGQWSAVVPGVRVDMSLFYAAKHRAAQVVGWLVHDRWRGVPTVELRSAVLGYVEWLGSSEASPQTQTHEPTAQSQE